MFGDDFRGYEEADDIHDVLELARPYLVPEGTLGEMLLSVGKTVYLHRKGADGVLDINPFSCMNGIVSEAVYPRLSRDCDGLPGAGDLLRRDAHRPPVRARHLHGPRPGIFGQEKDGPEASRPGWGGPRPSALDDRHPLGPPRERRRALGGRRRSSPSAGRTASTISGTWRGTTPSRKSASGGRWRTRRGGSPGTTTPWRAAAPRGGTSTTRRGRRPSGRGTGSPPSAATTCSAFPSSVPSRAARCSSTALPATRTGTSIRSTRRSRSWSTLFASVATGPIFFGHTHVAGGFVRRRDGRVEPVPPKEFRLRPGERALLNPGSVGQPRDRDRDASFLLFDTEGGR